jgi:hypothetical protein
MIQVASSRIQAQEFVTPVKCALSHPFCTFAAVSAACGPLKICVIVWPPGFVPVSRQAVTVGFCRRAANAEGDESRTEAIVTAIRITRQKRTLTLKGYKSSDCRCERG